MRANTSLQGGREHGLPVSLITMLPGERTVPMIDQVSAGRNCIKDAKPSLTWQMSDTLTAVEVSSAPGRVIAWRHIAW